MPEPVSFGLYLLGILVSEAARAGFGALFERVESRPAAPAWPGAVAKQQPVPIVDLVSGTPATARASVQLSVTTASAAPHWALFGVHPAKGQPYVIPVLYGEPVELRVARGEYGLSALFLTKPASFTDKPFLLAVGTGHEMLVSGRGQQVAVWGSPPTRKQISHLTAGVPAEQLPFILPLSKETRALLDQISPGHSLGRPLLPPQSARPAPGGLPSWIVATGTCEARNAWGERCNQPTPGRLCWEHLQKVQFGHEVLWHETGQRVRWDKRRGIV
jgi:hypothetical protein